MVDLRSLWDRSECARLVIEDVGPVLRLTVRVDSEHRTCRAPLPPEDGDGPQQLVERAGDLRGLLVIISHWMRFRWNRRFDSSGDSMVGEVRHGHGSGNDGGVELALERLELEGVVKRAGAVPDDRLGPVYPDGELLQRLGFLHFSLAIDQITVTTHTV